MPYVLIDHTVADFATWKPHFDDHEQARVDAGQQGYHLFRAADDPDRVVVLFEFDSEEGAREFVASPDLRERMREAGVEGEPEVTFLDEVDHRTVDSSR